MSKDKISLFAMSERIRPVIEQAIDTLDKDSYDSGHDTEHHLAVAQNCVEIAKHIDEPVNMDALLFAAMVHDYKRDDLDANNEYVSDLLEKNDFDEEFINLVITIINNHSFDTERGDDLPMEAKILFDADKLEYLSPGRLAGVVKSMENGEMEADRLQKYVDKWSERIPYVRNMLNFDQSKKEFDARANDLMENYSDDPYWGDAIQILENIVPA